jgi:predicted Zn-dependent peptidase
MNPPSSPLKNGILANAATALVAEFARIPPTPVLSQRAARTLAAAIVGFVLVPPLGAAERVDFTLKNGLRVRLTPTQDEKRVAVILGVRAGFLEEPRGVPHLAHVTEHLTVFDLRSPAERQAVQGWFAKGQANGETLGDLMYFDLHVIADELSEALKVQAARLEAVEFSRETLAREIPRTLQEIEFLEKSMQGGTGKFALAPFVQAALHGATDVPIKARTQKITVEEVRAFHARTFRPDRALLLVVGDFDPAATRKEIEQLFGPLRKPAAEPPRRPPLKPGLSKVTWDVPTRHLLIAWPLPPATEPDHAALTLAAQALMQRLFVDAELKTHVKMPLVSTNEEGMFLINVQLQSGADVQSVKTKVLDQVQRMSLRDGLTDLEVLQGKMMLAQLTQPVNLDGVRLPAHVTKTLARTNMELQWLMRELVWGDLAGSIKRAQQLKPEEVRATIARRLTLDQATLVQLEPKR